MKLVVGLGNPGEEYIKTRHNAGFIVLDNMLGKIDWGKSGKANTLYFKDFIGKYEVEYLKPQTFMNDSGLSVAYAKSKHKVKPKDIIVIYDDIDIPIGKIKISFDKSSGGHNGVESVIKHVKSQEFIRIRVGICQTTPAGKMKKPTREGQVNNFLLAEFKKDELETIKKLSKKISEVIEMIYAEGLQKAMTLYN